MTETLDIKLGVNIDHIATLRNARGEKFPDPIKAAEIALNSGADSITAHLREDRRHIKDEDISNIIKKFPGKLNLEIAANEEMKNIALEVNPFSCCIVPERREEVTTEGGLDVLSNSNYYKNLNNILREQGIRTSFFIDPVVDQVKSSIDCGVECVEFHMGKYCKLFYKDKAQAEIEFKKIHDLSIFAYESGLEVHLGHGLDFDTTKKVTDIPCLQEVNIGFFLIADSIFSGLENSIRKMKDICNRDF